MYIDRLMFARTFIQEKAIYFLLCFDFLHTACAGVCSGISCAFVQRNRMCECSANHRCLIQELTYRKKNYKLCYVDFPPSLLGQLLFLCSIKIKNSWRFCIHGINSIFFAHAHLHTYCVLLTQKRQLDKFMLQFFKFLNKSLWIVNLPFFVLTFSPEFWWNQKYNFHKHTTLCV